MAYVFNDDKSKVEIIFAKVPLENQITINGNDCKDLLFPVNNSYPISSYKIIGISNINILTGSFSAMGQIRHGTGSNNIYIPVTRLNAADITFTPDDTYIEVTLLKIG